MTQVSLSKYFVPQTREERLNAIAATAATAATVAAATSAAAVATFAAASATGAATAVATGAAAPAKKSVAALAKKPDTKKTVASKTKNAKNVAAAPKKSVAAKSTKKPAKPRAPSVEDFLDDQAEEDDRDDRDDDDDDQEEEEEEQEEARGRPDNWFVLRAMWSSIDGKWFAVHWNGFDQLVDFSVQERDQYICLATERRCMTESIRKLYPWDTANEANDLLNVHEKKKNGFSRPVRWLDFWTMTFEQVFRSSRDLLQKARFNLRRKYVLQHCVKALWPLPDESSYLAHLVVGQGADAAHYDKISTGFFVFDATIDVEFFNRATLQKIMQPAVAARYPWQNCADGIAMIRNNIAKPNLTYRQLPRAHQTVAQQPLEREEVEREGDGEAEEGDEDGEEEEEKVERAQDKKRTRFIGRAPAPKRRRPMCMDSDSDD